MSLDYGLFFRQLCAANAFLNGLASCLLVYLIHDMVRVQKVCKYSDFIYMVAWMSLYLVIYDFSGTCLFVCRDTVFDIDGLSICFGVTVFFNDFAGLASSAWSDVIILVVLYVATTQRRFGSNYLRITSAVIFVFSFLNGFFTGYYAYMLIRGEGDSSTITAASAKEGENSALQVYSGSRLALAVTAFAAIALLALLNCLAKRRNRAFVTASSSSPYAADNMQDKATSLVKAKRSAIETLTTRLVYYPIVFIIARASASWYEFQFQSSIVSFPRQGASSVQFAAAVVYALFVPLTGGCSFAIFLRLQPCAWPSLKRLFAKCHASCLGAKRAHDAREENTDIVSCAAPATSAAAAKDKEGVAGACQTSIVVANGRASSSSRTSARASTSLQSSSSLPSHSPLHCEQVEEERTASRASVMDDIPPPFRTTASSLGIDMDMNKSSMSASLTNTRHAEFIFADFDDEELLSVIVLDRASIQMQKELASSNGITERVSKIFDLQDA